jgi:hypothetical protein
VKTALDVLNQTNHLILKDKLKMARVGFKAHNFKAVYRYENPFIYPPAFVAHDSYHYGNIANFVYQDLKSTFDD